MRKGIWLIILLALAACTPGTPLPAGIVVPSETPSAPAAAGTEAATPSPEPPRHTLTICLGSEPQTLFPLAAQSQSAQTVLSAVYSGALQRVHFGWQSEILTHLPSQASGDMRIEAVPVQAGDEVLNADGQPMTLDDGARVLPSGCRESACAVTFERGQSLEMDQMQVVFHLRDDLRWADGEPLTADDSVYAWQLAADPSLSQDYFLLDRTASYRAVDAHTLTWVGKPGYLDPIYQDNFWPPLPAHLWAQFAPQDLPDQQSAARLPLGWGPYVLQNWETGEAIYLTRNPIYAGEKPFFDELVFRFTPDAEAAVAALVAGDCDVLDVSVPIASQADLLAEMAADGQAQLLSASDLTMEVLAPGIQPAAYDDGYQPGPFGDRPDYFGDGRMRQALAWCLDRQRVADEVLDGLTYVPDSFIPFGHPLFDPNTPIYTYDPERGKALLDEVGWKDLDGDPETPRTAWSAVGVPQGTPLVLQYWTTDAPQRRMAAEIYGQSLAACGIGLETHFLPPEDFFADGPDGVLFGRQFDLAQYAMGVLQPQPPCYWYLQEAIPSAANDWIGTNLSGYSNANFDLLCQQAMHTLPDEPAYQAVWQRLGRLFAEDLPVIPLYARYRLAAARPDLLGLDFQAGTPLLTWNLSDWRLAAP